MIIGLSGFKQVGKDTVANHLIWKYDFIRLAMADKLKEAFAITFGCMPWELEPYKNDDTFMVGIGWENEAKPIGPEAVGIVANHMWSPLRRITYRQALQNVGNGYRSVFGEDFWISQVVARIREAPDKDYVITDCRYVNELRAIKGLGGYVFRINRPGYGSDGHISEQPPPAELVDYYIDNSGTTEALHSTVDWALNSIEVFKR